MNMDFLIHKLIWELRSADEKQAVEAQKQASALSENKEFLNKLETELMRLVPADLHVHIDKLEVDLDWEDHRSMAEQLVESITKEIKQQVEESRNLALNQSPKQVQRPVAQSVLESVITFVKNGNLPENAPAQVRTLEQFVAFVLRESKSTRQLRKELRTFLYNTPELVDELTHWPLPSTLKLINDEVEMADIAEQIETMISGLDITSGQRRLLRKAMLQEMIQNRSARPVLTQ